MPAKKRSSMKGFPLISSDQVAIGRRSSRRAGLYGARRLGAHHDFFCVGAKLANRNARGQTPLEANRAFQVELRITSASWHAQRRQTKKAVHRWWTLHKTSLAY